MLEKKFYPNLIPIGGMAVVGGCSSHMDLFGIVGGGVKNLILLF